MLCYFLLYNKVSHLYVYIYPHNPSLLSLLPTLDLESVILSEVSQKEKNKYHTLMHIYGI